MYVHTLDNSIVNNANVLNTHDEDELLPKADEVRAEGCSARSIV